MWFAGLPAAFCGWMLEAVKQAGDNPPAENGAGYNSTLTPRDRCRQIVHMPPADPLSAGAFLYFTEFI